eukprot:4409058-Pyramimonas_sp.AAC.1
MTKSGNINIKLEPTSHNGPPQTPTMGPAPSTVTKSTEPVMNPTPTTLSFTHLPPRQDVQKVKKEEGREEEEGRDIRLTIGGNLTAQRQQMSVGGSLRDHCAALFHKNCGTTNT